MVTTQLAAVERARDALIRTEAEEPNTPAALLFKLKGIGPEFASLLWLESLFRSFGNRRQVAAYAGLAPSPWQSGGVERDQGISKSGNRRLRRTNRAGLVASSAGLGARTIEQTRRSPRAQAISVRNSVSPSIESVLARRCRRATAIEAASTTWLSSRRRAASDESKTRPIPLPE